MLINALRPSSELRLLRVGVGVISRGVPSSGLNIVVVLRGSGVSPGGGLGVRSGQSDVSSSCDHQTLLFFFFLFFILTF